jgi:hypothetical protein
MSSTPSSISLAAGSLEEDRTARALSFGQQRVERPYQAAHSARLTAGELAIGGEDETGVRLAPGQRGSLEASEVGHVFCHERAVVSESDGENLLVVGAFEPAIPAVVHGDDVVAPLSELLSNGRGVYLVEE